jgi:DNA mismatch repair protein MutS
MSAGSRKLTPMMQQYLEVRRQLPANTLLLFRLGDFYEMFDDDARAGARLLGITLTQRNSQPMAGIPYHAADNYIQKLLAAGKKVAVCDQMEAPRPGQLVRRSLTRILTPGTTLEEHQLEAGRHQYLLACDRAGHQTAAAWLDLTTGEFQIARAAEPAALASVLAALDPREVILPEDALAEWRAAGDADSAALATLLDRLLAERPHTAVPGFHFDPREGARLVRETLGVLNLDGFGIAADHPGLGPAGALLQYATDSLRAAPANIRRIREYRPAGSLQIDPATLRNLEIFRAVDGRRDGSLLAAMDGTGTAAGARLLEQFLAEPPLDLGELRRRQDCVEEFLDTPACAAELHEYLGETRDLQRILGRLRNRLRNPRELGAVRDTLLQLPLVRGVLSQFNGPAVTARADAVHDFAELRELLQRALRPELPVQLSEGGAIADGYDAELDRLRNLGRDSRTWLADLEAAEIRRTGIRNLRIKFNGAFGYFIEITKSNLGLVPDNYIRRQTMTNAERYTTPELKEKEKEILHADELAVVREEELFAGLAEAVLAQADALEACARALAEIDLYLGWARRARDRGWCRAQLDDGDTIDIRAGRHPVVEQMLRRRKQAGEPGAQDFVPNDTLLGAGEDQIAIITGPNMAGKSTYIRQAALIVLMAQTGCPVPAESCRVGLVDRIFSRVGASDELARGNSTFMVEMNETANILNNASDRSLIILDEIGRGTSTYDGLSIAWAVVEHLHGAGARGPRTLFATHYHELTQLARKLPRVRNYNVAVKEWSDSIIFVRQVVPGAADRSYGIHVARLAGLPQSVIDRAQVILERLESDDSSHNLLRRRLRADRQAVEEGRDPGQLELF